MDINDAKERLQESHKVINILGNLLFNFIYISILSQEKAKEFISKLQLFKGEIIEKDNILYPRASLEFNVMQRSNAKLLRNELNALEDPPLKVAYEMISVVSNAGGHT